MKITFTQLILVGLLTSHTLAHPVFAQELLKERVNLNLKNSNLRSFLRSLEKQVDVVFSYQKEVVESDEKLTLHFQNETVDNILKQVLSPRRIYYRVINTNQIILIREPRNDPGKLDPSVSNQVEFAASEKAVQVVTGHVKDEKGEGLPGVSILIKGTQQGTVTDAKGAFSLAIPSEHAVLVFSFVGYIPQEVAIGNQTSLEVSLKIDQKSLGEVVVVGYGTQRKKDLTGSIVNLTSKDLVPVPSATSVDQMMQGKVAGVQITQTSGAPGGNVNVIVRGISSITGGNSPLYVVDGYAIGTGGGGSDLSSFASSSYSANGMASSSSINRINPLSIINPADIESIQVLKDASATAIYGSRGANGVIIITTKRGKLGKPTISFEQSTGMQELAKKVKLLTPRQYAENVAEGRDNAWIFAGGKASDPNSVRSAATQVKPAFRTPEQFADQGYGTDWQDVIFRKGMVQNYQLSVNGTGKDVSYYVSGGFFTNKGIIIGSDFNKFTLRTNIDAHLSEKLKIGASFSGAHSYGNFARAEGHLQYRGLINAAVSSDPTIPVYNADGTPYSEFSSPTGIPVENPVVIAAEFSDKRNNTNVFTNNYLQYELLPGLVLKTSVGINYSNNITRLWKSSKVGLATSRTGQATAGSTELKSLNWLNENTINYRHKFGEQHNLDVLAGYTIQKNSDEILQAGATGFSTDYVPYLSAGTVTSGTNYVSEWALMSWLARVNYAFVDKYLLTATIRQDGSSRFGSKNRWGTFPSLSVAYRLSDEPFIKSLNVINDFKLRASYGVAGNNLIPNYATQGLLGISRTVSNGQVVSGLVPSSLANDQLTWEQSVQTNLGFDISLFRSRLSVTFDAYRAIKQNLLLNVTLPAASGFNSSVQNIGEIENKGLELTVNSQNIMKGPFQWSTDFNISWNRNKVLALNSASSRIATSDYQVAQVGYPIASFRLLQILGIFQTQDEISKSPIQNPRVQPGDYRFFDADGNGVINTSDKTIVGNPWPKFTWGLGNRFSYRNLSLSISLNGSYGNQIYFQGGEVNMAGSGVQNQLAPIADRWRSPENPGAGLYARAIRNDYAFSVSPGTTRYLFDGSYTRIRDVNLAYTFPASTLGKWKLQALSVYADITNLYTFTNYPSYDPEGSTSGDNLAKSGVDFYSYPNPRTYTVGLRVTF
ncbi:MULTISPECIES: TonB-dependent receptor [unclassified Spirosoma]|uniref:SusC/RagA family TonB-linked outer membrane protein n=1 Tax=unclassified Spirosoma TaxID=2621999 RepID=UPI0025E07125|nr:MULTISPECIES: TonB-dependent receptor [unclassified Spirosoma]